MSAVNLELIVVIALDKSPLEELEQFREGLNEALGNANYGSCGEHTLTATGYFEFPCHLSNLHDGLNLLREHCAEMKPKPKVEAWLNGEDNQTIQLFPRNDFAEYLRGLDKGEKFI